MKRIESGIAGGGAGAVDGSFLPAGAATGRKEQTIASANSKDIHDFIRFINLPPVYLNINVLKLRFVLLFLLQEYK